MFSDEKQGELGFLARGLAGRGRTAPQAKRADPLSFFSWTPREQRHKERSAFQSSFESEHSQYGGRNWFPRATQRGATKASEPLHIPPCSKRAASQADQTVRPHMLELGALTPSSASLRPPQKACTTPVREDDDFRCDDGRLPHLTGFEEGGLPACQSRCEEEHECAFVSYWINSK